MDNCGDQNKNNTILKTCAYIVAAGWYKNVNVILLVKGHTKNSCDRSFNLLKHKWNKTNVYTYQQAVGILGECEKVTVVDAIKNIMTWNQL